jgi:hypothetical protein
MNAADEGMCRASAAGRVCARQRSNSFPNESVELLMDPLSRFLIGSLFNAALYYVLGRVLWPSEHSVLGAVAPALLWGLLMRALTTRRERLKGDGKEPYPLRVYALAGLLGLGLCFACWRTFAPHPTGAESFGLLGGIALSLYAIGCAFTLARRRRARAVAGAPRESQ